MMTAAQGVSARIKGSVMRRCLVALCLLAFCLLAFATRTQAQDFDMPTLRGSSPFIPASPKYTRWAGFYGGGHAGYALGHMDFTDAYDSSNIFDSTNATYSPLGAVSNWASFGKGDYHAGSYGGFVGYNTQWADAIVGLEINYNRTSLRGSSDVRCSTSAGPPCPPAISLGSPAADYNVTVDATAAARITDHGTFRVRGGWVYGNMLGYGFLGVAVARVETTQLATASFTPVNAIDPPQPAHTEQDHRTRYTWGYSIGGGVDYLIMPNVFVRGEYEYIKLNPVAGINLAINTARVGIGLKF